MDELELLKKDWKKQEKVLPKLSYDQIYKMILKKSSSIVKWIFVISILEFVLWASIDIIFRVTGNYEKFEVYDLKVFSNVSTIISYAILVFFIVKFYLNYKRIQTTDSAKVLMQNILNTRKTVKHYVWTVIVFLTLTTITLVGYMAIFTDKYAADATQEQVPVYVIILITLFVLAMAIGIVALFYRIVYGILTRKLKRNYTELEKLEI